MVEDITKLVGIITYITSSGKRLEIRSDMNQKQVQTIQREYWDSYATGYRPSSNNDLPKKQEKNIENIHRQKHHQHQ